MTAKTLLCETEHVVAIEQDLGGDTVVVTFNEMGFSRKGLNFWADDFLRKQGLSAIGIVTPTPNWYPHSAMDEVLAAIAPRIGHRKVITIGHGHGGYGALKFSARLQASAALALSPQWSIDPADVGSFDSRFAKYFKDFLTNGRRIEQEDLSCSGFVVYDNLQRLSSEHAARLAKLRGVLTIRAPFFMRGGGLGTEGRTVAALIELCTRQSPPEVTGLRQVVRVGRKQSKAYLHGMLRQLILRVSHSARHSAVFASAMLDNTDDECKDFHAALLSHAQGNSIAALSKLRSTTTQSLQSRDLLPVWQVARELHFPEAELAVANEIRAKLPANTWACLCAVSTPIRQGDAEAAHHELTRLTTNADAPDYIEHFVEHSLELQKPAILEAFLAYNLSTSARITVLFALVDGYLRAEARKSAFEKLMLLEPICADSPEHLRKVGDLFVELGEFSMALDIRRRLLRSAPGDYSLALDVVDVKIRNGVAKEKKKGLLDLKKSHAELTTLMKTLDLPAAAWERASQLYDTLGDLNEALRAIEKAVALPEPSFEIGQRFVVLLERKGRKRAARGQLEKLFLQNGQDVRRLRILCAQAIRLRDGDLARRLADAQFALAPDTAESILVLARQLSLLGDRTRAQKVLATLFERERSAPFISNQQWIRLAQGLYEAGDMDLTETALAGATEREPKSPELRKLAATFALAKRLGRPISLVPARDGLPELPSSGFLSRLRAIFWRQRAGRAD